MIRRQSRNDRPTDWVGGKEARPWQPGTNEIEGAATNGMGGDLLGCGRKERAEGGGVTASEEAGKADSLLSSCCRM